MLFKYWFCELILLTVIGAVEVKFMNNIENFCTNYEMTISGIFLFALMDNNLSNRLNLIPISYENFNNNLTCKNFIHKTFQFRSNFNQSLPSGILF